MSEQGDERVRCDPERERGKKEEDSGIPVRCNHGIRFHHCKHIIITIDLRLLHENSPSSPPDVRNANVSAPDLAYFARIYSSKIAQERVPRAAHNSCTRSTSVECSETRGITGSLVTTTITYTRCIAALVARGKKEEEEERKKTRNSHDKVRIIRVARSQRDSLATVAVGLIIRRVLGLKSGQAAIARAKYRAIKAATVIYRSGPAPRQRRNAKRKVCRAHVRATVSPVTLLQAC